MKILLKAVRLIEPTKVIDAQVDVLVVDGRIERIEGANTIVEEAQQVIEGQGLVLLPGLFDMHVHLREPGYEYKEDIATGTRAAARGGVTGVLAMPNTYPTVESRAIVEDIQQRIADKANVEVKLTGSITKGLQGMALSDIEEMIEAGIVAITDDGKTTMSMDFMREAMNLIKAPDLVLISHAEDHDMVKGGAIHEGAVSERLGITGIPAEAEFKIVKRDIDLARETGARLHIAHISTKEAIDYVRDAQAEGLPVTAEAGPHHFMLTDAAVETFGPMAKVNPPLRSEDHRAAVEAGIIEGVISVIATDHAPHSLEEKSREIYAAPFGISGVELSLAFTYTHFVQSGKLTWLELAQKMSLAPRLILNLPVPTIEVGALAEMVLFDPSVARVHHNADMTSKGQNTPFEGMTFNGDVLATWYRGQLVYQQLKF